MTAQENPPFVARLGFFIGAGVLLALAIRFFSHISPENPGSLQVAFSLGSALSSGALLLLLSALWPSMGLRGGPVMSGLRWGGVVGGIGFLGGFLGPLLLYPEVNLGPILGILVTGPLGWSVGVIAGLFLGALRDGTKGGRDGQGKERF